MSIAITTIEEFAKPFMGAVIAHDYKHSERVRYWARRIAIAEGYHDLEMVEAAALLHDIGLSRDPGRAHAHIGASMAEAFLREQRYFTSAQIEEIVDAIRHHSSLDGQGLLWKILQDADGLELFGAVGVLRGISSKSNLVDYDAECPEGQTSYVNAAGFTRRFEQGLGVGPTIMDQLNFQVSCYENLHTRTAKQLAAPRVAFLHAFVRQFVDEIHTTAVEEMARWAQV